MSHIYGQKKAALFIFGTLIVLGENNFNSSMWTFLFTFNNNFSSYAPQKYQQSYFHFTVKKNLKGNYFFWELVEIRLAWYMSIRLTSIFSSEEKHRSNLKLALGVKFETHIRIWFQSFLGKNLKHFNVLFYGVVIGMIIILFTNTMAIFGVIFGFYCLICPWVILYFCGNQSIWFVRHPVLF